MISIHHHLYSRFLSTTLVRHKTLKTIKSVNDEHENQALLKRLKNISVIGEKKKVKVDVASKDGERTEVARNLPLDNLEKLIKKHISDPLTWNASVLSRIYKIPEFHCKRIITYVRPLVFLITNKHETPQKLLKTTTVIDVARLKSDDDYLVIYKKIVFPDANQKLPIKPLIS